VGTTLTIALLAAEDACMVTYVEKRAWAEVGDHSTGLEAVDSAVPLNVTATGNQQKVK